MRCLACIVSRALPRSSPSRAVTGRTRAHRPRDSMGIFWSKRAPPCKEVSFECHGYVIGSMTREKSVFFVYPRSKVIACKNRLWRSEPRFIAKDTLQRMLEMTRQEQWQRITADIWFDIWAPEHISILNIYVRTDAGRYSVEYRLTPVWTVNIIRIQRWTRVVLNRRKALALAMGLHARLGTASGLMELGDDLACMCMAMAR